MSSERRYVVCRTQDDGTRVYRDGEGGETEQLAKAWKRPLHSWNTQSADFTTRGWVLVPLRLEGAAKRPTATNAARKLTDTDKLAACKAEMAEAMAGPREAYERAAAAWQNAEKERDAALARVKELEAIEWADATTKAQSERYAANVDLAAEVAKQRDAAVARVEEAETKLAAVNDECATTHMPLEDYETMRERAERAEKAQAEAELHVTKLQRGMIDSIIDQALTDSRDRAVAAARKDQREEDAALCEKRWCNQCANALRAAGPSAPTESAPKCQCQWEAGDSPCPLHGQDEGEPLASSPAPAVADPRAWWEPRFVELEQHSAKLERECDALRKGHVFAELERVTFERDAARDAVAKAREDQREADARIVDAAASGYPAGSDTRTYLREVTRAIRAGGVPTVETCGGCDGDGMVVGCEDRTCRACGGTGKPIAPTESAPVETFPGARPGHRVTISKAGASTDDEGES